MTTSNAWFARTTVSAATWTLRDQTEGIAPTAGTLRLVGNQPTVAIHGVNAVINGTAELPPFALLAQATWSWTANAPTLTAKLRLAAAATFTWTGTASLRVGAVIVPPPDPVTEVLPLPVDIIPANAQWRLLTNTSMHVSPLTGKTQTIGRGGERWACTLTYRNLQGGRAALLTAALAALRGTLNRVVLPDHAYVRRGALAVDVAVVGAAQTGSTLACDGGTPNVARAVMAGDMFTLESRLYMITEDASTNVSGNLTLAFVPPLTEPPADNAVVSLLTPTARFALAGNDLSWTYSPGGFTSFNAVEFVEDRT